MSMRENRHHFPFHHQMYNFRSTSITESKQQAVVPNRKSHFIFCSIWFAPVHIHFTLHLAGYSFFFICTMFFFLLLNVICARKWFVEHWKSFSFHSWTTGLLNAVSFSYLLNVAFAFGISSCNPTIAVWRQYILKYMCRGFIITEKAFIRFLRRHEIILLFRLNHLTLNNKYRACQICPPPPLHRFILELIFVLMIKELLIVSASLSQPKADYYGICFAYQ